MINVQLLEETMARILAEPENWFQGTWIYQDSDFLPEGNVCGTAMCFAGHAAVLSGGRLSIHEGFPTCIGPDDGRVWHISSYATRVLGLTFSQADELFEGTNTLDDLQRIVKMFVEEAGQTS